MPWCRAGVVLLCASLGAAEIPPSIAIAATIEATTEATIEGEATTLAEPSPEDIERARELYDNGVALYEEGSYEGAALAFERAYELSEDDNLLYNIALAYDRLGQFERAIEYLDRYRALAPQSERAELERRKKSLQIRLEKQRQAQVRPGEPEPAEDDEALDEAVIPAPEPDAPPRGAPRPRVVPPAAWALGGTAVVGLGLGTGFGVASLRASRSGQRGCTDVGAALYCGASSGPKLERSRTYALVADVSFAVAAAATVGAVVLVAVAARRRKRGQLAALPWAWLTGAGATLSRRF